MRMASVISARTPSGWRGGDAAARVRYDRKLPLKARYPHFPPGFLSSEQFWTDSFSVRRNIDASG